MEAEIDIQDIDKWIRKEKGLLFREIVIQLDNLTNARFIRKSNDSDEFEFKGVIKKGE